METLRISPSFNKHFVNYFYLCGFKYLSTRTRVRNILRPTSIIFSDVMIDGTRILIRGSIIHNVKAILESQGFTVIIED